MLKSVIRTPLRRLEVEHGVLWLKDETEQITRAFKIRGAVHKMHLLGRPNLVVAASTGNHAICVSFAARCLGTRAVVFVPGSTPSAKIDAILVHGASIKSVQGDYESAFEAAQAFSESNGAILIHSFDDPQIIEGHLSLFREIDADLGQSADRLFVPVGGGGLLAAALRASAGTATQVFAVEFEGAQRLKTAMIEPAPYMPSNQLVAPPSCEGLVIRSIGQCAVVAARSAARLDVVSIGVSEMVEAAQLLWKVFGVRSELAGAAATAAALKLDRKGERGPAAAVISGGNISDTDFAKVLAGTL